MISRPTSRANTETARHISLASIGLDAFPPHLDFVDDAGVHQGVHEFICS
jgi:hypothetical protein